jgi:Spermatogenesis-assoc protein 6
MYVNSCQNGSQIFCRSSLFLLLVFILFQHMTHSITPFFCLFLQTDLTVRIELIQLSTYYEDGRLLAWHEGSAHDFLYPYPHYNVSYGTSDREMLLERTLSFPVSRNELSFYKHLLINSTHFSFQLWLTCESSLTPTTHHVEPWPLRVTRNM